jgi:hypothetical protein
MYMNVQNYVLELVVIILMQYGEGIDVVCSACPKCVELHIYVV